MLVLRRLRGPRLLHLWEFAQSRRMHLKGPIYAQAKLAQSANAGPVVSVHLVRPMKCHIQWLYLAVHGCKIYLNLNLNRLVEAWMPEY
jgi:hypothetical protein